MKMPKLKISPIVLIALITVIGIFAYTYICISWYKNQLAFSASLENQEITSEETANTEKSEEIQDSNYVYKVPDEEIFFLQKLARSSLTVCGGDMGDAYFVEHLGMGINVYDLEESKKLLQVFCGVGAYQASSEFYIDNGLNQPIQLVQFEYLDKNSDGEIISTNTTSLVTAIFDEEFKTITSSYCARGLCDCGNVSVYQYSDGNFELISTQYYECSPTSDGTDFENWEVLR